MPQEVANNKSQTFDPQKTATEYKNKNVASIVRDDQKPAAKPTQQDKRQAERIAVSPIDVNSIKIGPVDVNKDWVDYAFAVFSFCLVGIGFLQWWVYRRQAGYMRENLELTKQVATTSELASKLSLRAWINVSIDPISIKPNSPTGVNILIDNAGKSPGKIKIININNPIVFDGAYPTINSKSVPLGRLPTIFTIPPEQPMFRKVTLEPMPQGRVDAITSGATSIIISGNVFYDDVFNDRHYCNFYRAYRNGEFIVPIEAPPEYNEAD